jgi:hypothetical protein
MIPHIMIPNYVSPARLNVVHCASCANAINRYHALGIIAKRRPPYKNCMSIFFQHIGHKYVFQ